MRLSCHVLYACWQTDPRVHSLLVDGERGDGEAGICEGAHWHGDAFFVVAFNCVVNCCTALGAKAEDDLASFVPNSYVLAGLAVNRDRVPRESCLGTEDTSGSALTREAMTDGDPNGVGSRRERQLTAAAGGCSGIHGAAKYEEVRF